MIMAEGEKNGYNHKFPETTYTSSTPGINLLNINAKVVVDYPTLEFFLLHHGVLKKRGHVLSQRRRCFKKRWSSFS